MKKICKMTALLIMFTMLLVFSAGCSLKSSESSVSGGSGDGGNDKVTQSYTWKLAHEEYKGELEDIYANYLKEALYDLSDGAINLEIYTVGEIGDGTNLFELTQTGTVEFGISDPGWVTPVIPEAGVFSCHFLFPRDIHDFDALLEGDSQGIAKMNELYEEQGVDVLQWAVELGNAWTADRKISTPDDFKGVKFRTMASSVISKSYDAYGASAVPISYSELYSALQLNMVDGQVNPVSAIVASSFYEVQDYLILSYPDSFLMTISANKDFLDSLPEQDRKVVEEAVQLAYEKYKEKRDKMNEEWLNFLKNDSGLTVIELTDDEVAAFRKIAEKNRNIFTDIAPKHGEEVLELFTEDIENLDADN
ncbi:MAG: TRAP transporter substrate-binding protein DctP [Eubacteriales bacterium]|nr:TRAP transporter substrate-binding protein DctP [Eubacteriales bacterium]